MKTYIVVLTALLLCSCKEERPKAKEINVPNYTELAQLDVKLGEPKDGDWLKQHPEKFETFDQYITKKPVTVSDGRNTIYLQPMGEFTPAEKKMLDLTAEYVGYFFCLRTLLLKPIATATIPEDKKRMRFGAEQLDASYIIHKILPGEIPPDGIVLMGLTANDLYPNPEWNYVFGLASYSKRTAVTSMYRFAESPLDEKNYSLCLNRLIKVSVHEIGHMFTVPHCVNAACLMNGANHIVEVDESPNALCSLCLAKLSWNLDFDNAKRMEALVAFCERHQLNSDAAILKKQYTALKKN